MRSYSIRWLRDYQKHSGGDMRTYYHGSNTLYDYPSFEFIDNWTPKDDRAVKVVLGIYVTPNANFAAMCGKYVYEIRMKPCKPFSWLFSDMVKFYNSVTANDQSGYNAMKHVRKAMAVKHDIVHIIEHDGSIGECFIVDLDGIETFRLVNLDTKTHINI